MLFKRGYPTNGDRFLKNCVLKFKKQGISLLVKTGSFHCRSVSLTSNWGQRSRGQLCPGKQGEACRSDRQGRVPQDTGQCEPRSC